MKAQQKVTLITENKGNDRLWIQGDRDVENHGFTDGQVFTIAYGDSEIELKLTGLKRQKGMRVDKEFKRKNNLPQHTMKVSKTARGSTIDIGNKFVTMVVTANNKRGKYIPYKLKNNKDSNHNSMVFMFNN